MSERIPAECFAPGGFIADELEERGMTADDLARLSGWTKSDTDALLSGAIKLTVSRASVLQRIFGPDAMFWLNLERAYSKCLKAKGIERGKK